MADAYWQALGLAAPARRALIAHHCHTLADLCQYQRIVVAQWHGIGANALATLAMALHAAGLAFVGE
ncbi:MAG: RNA polymerase [Roseiflexaceae bacterium]|jgi:hypothetical protein|nr:hypothetical protein [Chloroflexaceae bacterium]MCE2851930.1 hypothetical protein [Chloroflexaceae bacterium]